jgi:hypothetical protein
MYIEIEILLLVYLIIKLIFIFIYLNFIKSFIEDQWNKYYIILYFLDNKIFPAIFLYDGNFIIYPVIYDSL